MRNRISRIIICFTLIMSLVICEAAVGLAAEAKTASDIKLGKVTSLKSTSVSYKAIKLSWNIVKGASGYKVYRSTSKSGPFKKIYTARSGKYNALTNTDLKLGTTYYYKVRPYKSKDGKIIDGELSKYTVQRAQPPAPVISSVKRDTYKSLKVSWKSVAGADGYRIYRSTSPNGTYKRIATSTDESKLSYIDDGRTCGARYYYKVRAYKVKGIKWIHSDASSYKSGRTTPSNTRFTEDCQSWYSSVELYWAKANGASGYVIYRSKSPSSGYVKIKTISSSKTTKWTNTGLNGGVKYYFKVRPYKSVNGTIVYGNSSKVYTKYLVPKNLSTLVKKYEGKPYKYGGNTPYGWDCSGFVQWAIKYLFGKEIPRSGGEQAVNGKYVDKDKMSTWRPGDVLVYRRHGGGFSHVGLYIGDGKIMHALNSRYDTVIQGVSEYEEWDRGNYLAGVRRY